MTELICPKCKYDVWEWALYMHPYLYKGVCNNDDCNFILATFDRDDPNAKITQEELDKFYELRS